MKAIIYDRYGSADVLRCEEVEQVPPRDNEVLIRVHAASVNPLDWHFMRGTPRAMRLGLGWSKPKITRVGVDVAGRVEAVGSKVTRFKPGDSVFGVSRGAFAEYVCALESELAIKPDTIAFEQAAALPIAALTAVQGLRDKGRLQPGQKVLVNGASGGVGTFTVQIAKHLGAHVTGVCSTRNVDLVQSLGADRVVDYTKEDVTKLGDRYDIFLDCVINHSLSACRRVLNPKGRYIMIGGGTPNDSGFTLFGRVMKMQIMSLFASQSLMMMMAKANRQDLATLAELMSTSKIRAAIDRCYPLHQVPDAIRYVEAGHARGKVIVSVEQGQ